MTTVIRLAACISRSAVSHSYSGRLDR